MTALIPFEYRGQRVRTVSIGGDPHFLLKDVRDALNLKNSNAVVTRIREDDGVAVHYPITDRLGRIQDAVWITEPGLYRLAFQSRVPGAEQFTSWVTTEVLPSIRKRGGYLTPEATEKALTDPDFIIRLATDLKNERARRAELEAQTVADAPKVLFADAVAASETSILVGDLAKILKGNGFDIGANRLFALLREEGYLIKRRGTDWNMPTQKSMELGLFEVKETAVTHADGHVTVNKTPKVTGKGQTYFTARYLRSEAA